MEKKSPDGRAFLFNIGILALTHTADLLSTNLAIKAGAIEVGIVPNFLKNIEPLAEIMRNNPPELSEIDISAKVSISSFMIAELWVMRQ
ncbi:MAG: hypothetical protein UX91_C0006G0084 [Candidatus Amesbacteria bacterium GW2011_GWB1_47_19]|nr:MAG: hypothetical protein UW51_C0002G0085 [Candidatus Amesbacteria bacterium GW2011_GWA1_44_24]KKU31325.1 MAG: hypothetical protein UX46_C0006G0117 [Candidatus Amesbacteria bacterium GW2011_GWC1_46_24]KKU67022.1 MAG: hypothetical protein UX91_C0006G0084 [Candidatus Amesbacteria bacterium GW2011_GWB1_47_19]OGD04819.1 MAG: hypothetical protein A2379_04600 [Candidatus Amesbacteria bacterium RIFOXYB1_FULL_47_13]HBC72759.1 hypothetical protein [Candidatus Amesbacteria bacterium]